MFHRREVGLDILIVKIVKYGKHPKISNTMSYKMTCLVIFLAYDILKYISNFSH